MNISVTLTAVLVMGLSAVVAVGQTKEAKARDEVSFKNDVLPIIKAKCLPCHSEDNFNPSELSMDSYDLMVKGGKHGSPFKAGASSESLVIQKLSDSPPFGDRMPLNSKKKIREGKAAWLTDEEIKTIAMWIDKGAKNN